MSLEAIRWAARLKIKYPIARALLLDLAERANTQALLWPSIETLMESTGLGRRTVTRELAWLQSDKVGGLLEDTKERRGRTGQIKVWRLRLDKAAKPHEREKRNGVRAEPFLFNDLKPQRAPGRLAIRKPSGPAKSAPLGPKKSAREAHRTSKGTPDSKESAAEPRQDPIRDVLDLGVAVLTSTGVDEQRARSLIGGWRKGGKRDGEVLQALLEARAQAVSEPVEWLTKRLKPARFVSANGHEYKGDLEAIRRQAEKRADWDTYWGVEREIRLAAEAKAAG